MPFLFPAVTSVICDSLIVWLHHTDRANHILFDGSNVQQQQQQEDDHAIYHVQYLVLLAVVRLILVVLPLTYHSYIGTAIRCPFLYRVFYGATLVLVLLHMLALSMLDPDSLATLVVLPPISTTSTLQGDSTFTVASSSNYEMVLVRRHCWWLLLLSLVATLAHIVMLRHVRSTAPAPVMPAWFSSKINESHSHYYRYGGRSHRHRSVLLYYAAKQQSSWRGNNNDNNNGAKVSSDNTSSNKNSNNNKPAMDNEEPTTPTQQQQQRANFGANHVVSPMQKFSSQYDEFVGEMQSRIHVLKDEWTKRLDDFTHRHLHYLHQNTSDADEPNSSNSSLTTGNGMARRLATTGNPIPNPLLPLTPFRVLLHLFAYEEVLNNGKLNAVFDIDNGAAMTFFVPQLLSFLLHGAYDDLSARLETWILNKCQTNVHFAHRCYWFLRAWCLEVSLPPAPPTGHPGTAPSPSTTARKSAGTLQRPGSNASGFLSLDSAPSHQPPQVRDHFMLARESEGDLFGLPSRLNSRNNSVTSLASLDSNNVNMPGKFLPEERAVIEDLLLRVVKCGEVPAQTLQLGPKQKNGPVKTQLQRQLFSHGEDQDVETGEPAVKDKKAIGDFNFQSKGTVSSTLSPTPASPYLGEPDYDNQPEVSLTPRLISSLPVDPTTGFPSTSHLETVTARRRYGYMPLDGHDLQRRKEHQPQDSLSTRYETEWFQSTPRFMDALISMADGLFLFPKDQRKAELKRQLRTLEVELLPSNSVYVPIGNVHHRVWRVVADESIALNTKERVPCIVCLEVVDYNSNMLREDKLTSKPLRSKMHFSLELPHLPPLPHLVRPQKTSSPPTKPPRSKFCEEAPNNNGTVLQYRRTDTTNDSEEEELEEEETDDEPVQLEPATSTIPLKFLLPSAGGATEYDVVREWRFAKRDPHRGDSILERMTSSMPQDMRERITKLREKGIHDILSLSIPDGIIVDPKPEDFTDEEIQRDSEIAAFICNDGFEDKPVSSAGPTSDTERSSRIDDPDNSTGGRGGSPGPLSRQRDAASSTGSMGQWCSPTNGRRKTVVERRKGRTLPEEGLIKADRRLGYASDEEFAYGSLQEHRKEKDSRPPRPNESAIDKSKTKRPPVVFRENWQAKEDRLRSQSAFGSHPGWRLLPILIKANDDLRQEQLASQLIYRMAFILARERIPVWLCPYEIIAVTDQGGIVEAIPDTISLDSLKRNDPNYTSLRGFLHSYFGEGTDALADAKSNFVESLAAYSMVTFLLQIKDRHNGNILIDNRGHLIHIDFGFFFLSSPGQNTGFESAPFKLTSDFVEVMGGANSRHFRTFRELCVRSFIALRRHCMEIILLVEMLKTGNEDLNCFRGRPDDAIRGLRERFRLDLSDRACKDYVFSLIDESLENWRTNWYDRYQRYCVGVL